MMFSKRLSARFWRKKVKPKSFWTGTEFSAETGTLELKAILGKGIFETPKPTGLIKYILNQTVGENDIVLDSFAGSALLPMPY